MRNCKKCIFHIKISILKAPPQNPRLLYFVSAFLHSCFPYEQVKDTCLPFKGIRNNSGDKNAKQNSRVQTLHLSIIMKNAVSVNCRSPLFSGKSPLTNRFFPAKASFQLQRILPGLLSIKK